MIVSLWGRIQAALLTAAAVILILVGVYAAGGRAARKAVEVKTQKRQIEAAQDRRDVEEEIRVLPDDRLADRLREWQRD